MAERRKRVSSSKTAKSSSEKANNNAVTSNKLELLITVVNKNKAEYYTDLIQSFDVNLQATAFGEGSYIQRYPTKQSFKCVKRSRI